MEIHPEAAKAAQNRANEILLKFRLFSRDGVTEPEFVPEVPVQGTITDKEIIGEIEMGVTDSFGNETGAYFQHKGKEIGLFGDDYKGVVKLAEMIQKQKSMRDKVSVKFLTKGIFS